MARLSSSIVEKLSTRIYKEFQALLIAGEFKPGEKLKVTELVEQTGTSVTPVREALIRLVGENAVEMYSPRTFAIPALSLPNYLQIRAMRIALEGLATEVAAEKITAKEIEDLHKIHSDFVDAEEKQNHKATLKHNRDFHFGIYRSARMPLLLTQIETLWAMTGPILNVFYGEMKTEYSGAEEHLKILSAFKAGDGPTAALAMQADLGRGGVSIERYLTQHVETEYCSGQPNP